MSNFYSKIAVFTTISVVIIISSCKKRDISASSSNYEQQMRRNSLEIENSEIAVKNLMENKIEAPENLSASTDKSIQTSAVIAEMKTANNNNLKSITTKSGVNKSTIKQQKISKFEVLKSAVKARSGLNSNIRIGIILLLIGILVSLFIGWAGSIVALIGVIFIIIGLLQII